MEIKKIENLNSCDNKGLTDSINFIITETSKQNNYIDMIKCLDILLNYQNYAKNPLYFINNVPILSSLQGESDGDLGIQQILDPGGEMSELPRE